MNDAAGLFGMAVALVVSGAILLVWYGVALLVFRHAFGIELPNPIQLLPAEWAWHLR